MGMYINPFFTFEVAVTSTVKVTVKVIIILILIVLRELMGSCNMLTYTWSAEYSILGSMQGITKLSGVNLLQLWFVKWPNVSVSRAEPSDGYFQNCSFKY